MPNMTLIASVKSLMKILLNALVFETDSLMSILTIHSSGFSKFFLLSMIGKQNSWNVLSLPSDDALKQELEHLCPSSCSGTN